MTEEGPEPIRRCANCGAELRPTDRYCGECGLPTFVTPSAEAPTPAAAPAAVPAATPESDNRAWAIVASILLLLIGAVACVVGALLMFGASWIAADTDSGWIAVASGLCCVLPALAMMIGGGIVWYVWGRKKS